MLQFLISHARRFGSIVITKRSKSGFLFALMTWFSLFLLHRLNLSFTGGIFEFLGSEPARNVEMTPIRAICLLFWIGIVMFLMQPLYASGRLHRTSVRRAVRLIYHLPQRLPLNRIRKFRRSRIRASRMQPSIPTPRIQTLQLSLGSDEPLQSLVKTLEVSSAEVIELSRPLIASVRVTDEDSPREPLVVSAENLPVLWHFLCDAQPPEPLPGSSSQPSDRLSSNRPSFDRQYLVSRSVLLNFLHLLSWSTQDSQSSPSPVSSICPRYLGSGSEPVVSQSHF